MTATTLFALAGLTLALALHPFTTYPLSLALLRTLGARRRPGRRSASAAALSTTAPSFSLLVCAHNEEAVILDKLRNLSALLDRAPGAAAEALIYVDGSSDRTAELARAWTDPRVRTVVSAARTGKTVGLNRLVALAGGDILVLSDANVTVEPEALGKLAARFADPLVGLVCGQLRYVNGEVNVTARNGAAYWRLEETIRALESDTGGAIGADGSLYAVRRELWPNVPDDLIDDFYVPMTVRFRGLEVIHAGEIVAFERTTESGRDEFRRKVRIACQAFNVHRRLWPAVRKLPLLDRYKYVSHKLLKWLIGFHLLFAGGFTALALGLIVDPALVVAASLLGSLLVGLSTAWGHGPFATLGNAVLMFAAVSWGVVRSLQGERFVIWQPAGSVRAGRVPLMPPPGRTS